MPQRLKIADITIDRRAQSRSAVNQDVVAEYAEAMRAEAWFPAVIVFFDGSAYWLADGFHRVDAALLAGFDEVDVDVRNGGLREAVLYSVGANASHGLQRTREDKRRAILTLLEDPEWSAWSDNEVARRCAVSPTTVGTVRRSLSKLDSEPEARTYTTRHGTVAQMDTSRIGRPASSQPSRPPAGNVIPLGDRLVPVVSEKAVEREAEAIEAAAKRRLADEYDAAQERGEVVGPKGGGDSTVSARNAATAADIGLTRKDIHEARIARDAEANDPGVTKRTVTALLDAGHEPTKAALRRQSRAMRSAFP